MIRILLLILTITTAACTGLPDPAKEYYHDSITVISFPNETSLNKPRPDTSGGLASTVQTLPASAEINVGNTTRQQIVNYALTLDSVSYLFAGTDPSTGFDCSGFITYVFNHFNIAVPRSSVDFTNVGREISISDAKPADLILFTGTDSTIRVVGHMGIVVENNDSLKFIHSSSGKANGVTISPLSGYYTSRFVKVIDVFEKQYR